MKAPQAPTKVRRRRRRRLLAAQHGLCAYCFEQMDESNATLDEAIPRSRGGRAVEGNSIVACKACNSAKGAMMAQHFLELLITERRPIGYQKSIHDARKRRRANALLHKPQLLPKPWHLADLHWPRICGSPRKREKAMANAERRYEMELLRRYGLINEEGGPAAQACGETH